MWEVVPYLFCWGCYFHPFSLYSLVSYCFISSQSWLKSQLCYFHQIHWFYTSEHYHTPSVDVSINQGGTVHLVHSPSFLLFVIFHHHHHHHIQNANPLMLMFRLATFTCISSLHWLGDAMSAKNSPLHFCWWKFPHYILAGKKFPHYILAGEKFLHYILAGEKSPTHFSWWKLCWPSLGGIQ